MSKCHKDGCHSAAEYHIALKMKCFDGTDIATPSTIKVCAAHVGAAKRYILSPENRAQIGKALTAEGMATPLFDTAEVLPVPINAEETNLNAAREAGMH